MEHEFWHERWAKKEIGFHEGTINQYLYEHWPELAGNGKEAVLVPLCGKAHDMWWLHDRGHPIIGVELSDIACKDFFEEAGEKAMVRPGEPFTRFKHDDLEKMLCLGQTIARGEAERPTSPDERSVLKAIPGGLDHIRLNGLSLDDPADPGEAATLGRYLGRNRGLSKELSEQCVSSG